MKSGRPIVFEGGQGALLDPEYGFTPHVTKTTIGFHNAHALLTETAQVISPCLLAELCSLCTAPSTAPSTLFVLHFSQLSVIHHTSLSPFPRCVRSCPIMRFTMCFAAFDRVLCSVLPLAAWLRCTFQPFQMTKIGVTRSYGSRHGHGPFVCEEFEHSDPQFMEHYMEPRSNYSLFSKTSH